MPGAPPPPSGAPPQAPPSIPEGESLDVVNLNDPSPPSGARPTPQATRERGISAPPKFGFSAFKAVKKGVQKAMGGTGGGRAAANPQGFALQPLSTADVSGSLHKASEAKLGDHSQWHRRFFMLHGSLLSYYDDESSAAGPDEHKCHGVGKVRTAEMWPAQAKNKPKQISDAVWNAHGACGMRIGTDERELFVYTDSEADATRWIDALKVAVKSGQAASPSAAPSTMTMPEQPELDRLLKVMLQEQGYKEEAKQNIMLLADAHKWTLLQGYQEQQTKEETGDLKDTPVYWINELNFDPQPDKLQ